MTTVKFDSPKGELTLHLQFDDQYRVLSAQGLGSQQSEQLVAWLTDWLPGKNLREAHESVGEVALLKNPQWGLTEARILDEVLKNALYRTHLKVEVTGSIICNCRKVTRETIREALQEPMTREELTKATKAGSGCGSCHHELDQLIAQTAPRSKRWHGEAHSHWILLIQDTLARFVEHNPHYPALTVKSFQEGIVKVNVAGALSADQEWELTESLANYWSEGFPAPLSVFLAFSSAQA